jgi:hypothetical protein
MNYLQKLGNPIEPVNKVSDYLSNTNIPNTDIPYSLPTNFIDIDGKYPNLKDKISTKNIVFKKENLTEYNWLFTLEKYSEVVEKSIKTCKWKWIVVRSSKMIEEIFRKENVKKQRDKQNKQNRYNNYKYTEQVDASKIPSNLIVAKYNTLKDFLDNKDNWREYPNKSINSGKHGNYDGAGEAIIKQYKQGDRIWHYSEFIIAIDLLPGTYKELFFLIRNDKIICSPIINVALC